MSEIKYTVLSIAEGKARCDSAMKALLSNIHILSRLLKELVPEYKGCSISDIEEKYIEKRSITISSSGVADHFPEVSAMSNEDLGFSEANIYYDILFRAAYPDGSGRDIGLYINIESQNTFHPGYPLEMRAIYYGVRLLSAQLKAINKQTNYGCLKKVYSIWLCMGDTPDREAGKVFFYRFQKQCMDVIINEDKASSEASQIVGPDLSEDADHKLYEKTGTDYSSKDGSGHPEQPEHYDLISVIMVSLNERTKVSSSILELIRILGSNKSSKLEKLQALRNNDIIVDNNMEKEVGYMCNWGEYMWQGGLKEGLEQGLEQGREQGLEQGINQGEEKLNSLYVFLMNDGKLEEMKRVMHDKAYRQELYKAYGL